MPSSNEGIQSSRGATRAMSEAKALAKIKILDLSRVFAAPFATQILSDLGATVWKIEALTGDDSRRWGDHVFNAYNRGKQSVAVDLKHPHGREIVRALAAKADVFVENFKVGDLARYGLAYDDLSEANPRLIYASLTGFGQTGPRRDQPGYDTVIQAMSGVMSVTGDPAGLPGKVGIAWIDVMSGLTLIAGVLAALYERKTSGRGQFIDLSLFDVGMMALVDAAQGYLDAGIVPQRQGNATRNIAPADTYQVQDGWISLAIGNDEQFHRLCTAMCLEELPSDKRYASLASRVAHRAELSDTLAPVFQTRARSEWLDAFSAAKVPASPVYDVAEALADAQSRARGVVVAPSGEQWNGQRVLGNALRHMSRTPAVPSSPPPRLGQHADIVLRGELGLDPARVAELRREGAIG